MIDEKSIEAYQTIKAPDSLREKVLAFQEDEDITKGHTRLRFLRPAMGLAACMVLFLGIVMPLSDSGSGNIFINGTKVGSEPVCISEEGEYEIATARMMDVLAVPITLEQQGTVSMTVSSGSLQVIDEDGSVVTEAMVVEKEEQQNVCWIINGWELDEEAVLNVTTEEYQMTYQVYKEDTSSLYYITLKEKVTLE